jgi:catalase
MRQQGAHHWSAHQQARRLAFESGKMQQVSGQRADRNHRLAQPHRQALGHTTGEAQAGEGPRPGPDHTPRVEGNLVRQKIERTNDFKQAGERFRAFDDWERDDLILNLVNTLKPADKRIQDKMIDLFTQCDEEYGRRVREGLQQTSSNGQHSSGPIGSTSTNEAVQQAEDNSKEAQPY